MSLELYLKTREHGTIVECRGRLVAGAELDSLSSAVEALLRCERRLVLNLDGLNSIDAAGLGVLAAAAELARKRGCAVLLCGTSKRVQKLLSLTRLDSVLQMHESERSALDAARQAAA